MSIKIVFDCDNTMGLPFKEVDDGLTLLYLLGVPEIELLGITTTFGNGSIDEVYPQTQQLVNHLGLELPVLKGEGHPNEDPNTPAARFLVDIINRYPQEITLLATGPVGNLHAAYQLEPTFYSKVKQIALMGGYLSPLRLGYRNLAELNLSANPEAALSLLYGSCPVTVFPAQTCLDAPFTLKDIRRGTWWPHKFRGMLIRWLLAFGIYCGITNIYLWDLLPAVYLTNPSLFELVPWHLTSTLTDMEKGVLVQDPANKRSTITLARKINDIAAFYDRLETAWKNTASIYPMENIP